MAIRKIREIGDDVLEKVCKEVTDMTDRTKVLIEDMLDTMYDAMGVGLAAPQVGILKRIVVIDIGEGPIILVNPEILETACSYMKSYAERMNRNQVRIIGPASPYVGKVNDVYRRVIYLKHARYEAMIDLKNKLEQYIEINSGFRKVRVQFDFNPMNVF